MIDADHTLERANVERVLGCTVARTFGLEFAVFFLLALGAIQRDELRLCQYQPS